MVCTAELLFYSTYMSFDTLPPVVMIFSFMYPEALRALRLILPCERSNGPASGTTVTRSREIDMPTIMIKKKRAYMQQFVMEECEC